MNTYTGEIVPMAEVERMSPDEAKHYVEMTIAPTKAQMRLRPPRVRHQDPCPCGSGKKFRRCCKETVRRSMLQGFGGDNEC